MEKKIVSSTSGRDEMRQFCAKYIGQKNADLPDRRLLALTESALLNAGIINQPIRHYQGTSYYFDESCRYCSAKTSERFPHLVHMTRDGQRRARLWDMGYALKMTTGAALNVQLWIKAASTFTEGETLRECLKKYLDTTIHRYMTDKSFVESMVTMISNPSIERAPGNSKKSSFDRIRVTVGLSSTMFDSFQDLRQAVIANKQEIHRMVLEKIEESRNFQTYGVPVNILALSSLNLWRDHTLEYIFEPKELTLDEKLSSASLRRAARASFKPRTTEKNERREQAHE